MSVRIIQMNVRAHFHIDKYTILGGFSFRTKVGPGLVSRRGVQRYSENKMTQFVSLIYINEN